MPSKVNILRQRFTEDEWAFLMRHGGFVQLFKEASGTVDEFTELAHKILKVERGKGESRTSEAD
jgi:hypothetical protein